MLWKYKHTSENAMLPLLDRTSEEPIRRQLYVQLKTQILNGSMRAGEALASTRQMASDLGISRSTVVEAYDMLLAEGFLESRQGAQTVVAAGVVMQLAQKPSQSCDPIAAPEIRADFTTGRPDLSLFPRALWARLIQQSAQTLSSSELNYSGPQGYLPLRQEIASWLSRSRGISVYAEDVFITAGATHALRILADLLCPNGGRVMLEDPCHRGLYDTLTAGNCAIVSVSADDHGLRTDLLTKYPRASMIYVTPSHQFPLGGILPAARRAALIRYAREEDVYIVEDDYDSEFRFSGAPISPLYALDDERVIYIGTFSKSVFPALRIGFALLPKQMQARWRYLRTHNDVQNPIFDQAALAAFLQTRAFDRYVRASKNRYEKRRAALIAALEAAFGADCTVCGDAAGLHLAVRIAGYTFDEAFERDCREAGVLIRTMEWHCIEKGNHMDQLVLGYGHMEPEKITECVKLLAQRVREQTTRS